MTMCKEKCCCGDAAGKDNSGCCGDDCKCKKITDRIALSDMQVRKTDA